MTPVRLEPATTRSKVARSTTEPSRSSILQGRSYVYAKTHLRIHLDQNMGRFYHNSDGLLMLCVQNVCVEPSILTKFVMMLVSPPHMHPFMICH